jgi:hypothetical protein
MNIQKKENKIWVGLATVKPVSGNFDLGNASGASIK